MTPLLVIDVHEGETATRYSLNDGKTYVAVSSMGSYCCLNSSCLGKRVHDSCEHVACVKDFEAAQIVAAAEAPSDAA